MVLFNKILTLYRLGVNKGRQFLAKGVTQD